MIENFIADFFFFFLEDWKLEGYWVYLRESLMQISPALWGQNFTQSNCAGMYIHIGEKEQYLACYLIFYKTENHEEISLLMS